MAGKVEVRLAFSPARRAKRIFEEIESNAGIITKPDVVILANATDPHCDNSFFYLTGFGEGLFEESYVLFAPDGLISLLTSPMEKLIADPHSNGMEIAQYSGAEELEGKLRKSVTKTPKIIGVNYSELTVESLSKIKSTFKDSKIVDVSKSLKMARLVKDQQEIESIQKACDVASRIYESIPSMLKEGVTEGQVAASMGYEMQRAGGSGVSFDTIVGFGKNSALPHHFAGEDKVTKGDLILLDYGSKYQRYCSDITRTMVYGKATRKQREMYDTVLEALRLGTDSCVASNTGEEVNSKIGSFIKSRGYKIIHGFGHSLGLAVHDGHGLDNNFDQLRPGMVITVEPAVYVQGLGGVRIEDDVLITKDKPKVLTTARRELIEV